MPSLERRVSRRYPINLPVLLEKGQGETRDISLQGVYILSPQSYPEHSEIVFTLKFDKTGVNRQKSLFFACRGRILRAEPQAERTGLAVQFLDNALSRSFAAGKDGEGKHEHLDWFIDDMAQAFD